MPTNLLFIEYFLYGFTKEIWWNLMLNRVHINVSCSCISGLVIFDQHFNYITKKCRKHFVAYLDAKLMFSIGCFWISHFLNLRKDTVVSSCYLYLRATLIQSLLKFLLWLFLVILHSSLLLVLAWYHPHWWFFFTFCLIVLVNLLVMWCVTQGFLLLFHWDIIVI